MDITIYDFMDLIREPRLQKVRIYSIKEDRNLYIGMLGSETVYDEYGNHIIRNIDTLLTPTDTLVLNVD